MKFPRILRIGNLLLYALFFTLGVIVSALHPEVPGQVMVWINASQTPGQSNSTVMPPPLPPRPTIGQYNEVLSDSLALVEAQHTFYVHVMHNERFAVNVKEMGSVKEKGGIVMVQSAYNASDAVKKPRAVHGYLFKCRPVVRGPDKKDGFAVLAFPEKESKWPLYLTIVADAVGGLPAMSSADTWEIEDEAAAKDLPALFEHDSLNLTDLGTYSPEKLGKSYLIKNFKKEAP